MSALALLLALALAGCASAFPSEVTVGVNREVTVAGLRAAEPGTFVNQRVIVGGEILATTPKEGQTEIEVLSRRLRSDESPERSDRSDGRFLVRAAQFLDPAVFAPGRRVTVLGTVTGEEQRPLGAVPFRYPVIASDAITLWPRDLPPYPYPYYYGPYWPYWGWGASWGVRGGW
ncbi:MAG: Slp family lipoprotein [Candidatus Rokuibacteriota bacterium]